MNKNSKYSKWGMRTISDIAEMSLAMRKRFGTVTRSFSDFGRTLREDRSVLDAMAVGLQARSLSPRDLKIDPEEFLADNFLSFHQWTWWAQSGFNIFNASDSLIASLALTDIENVADQIKFPFGTFAISIPDGYISIDDKNGSLPVRYLWLHTYQRLGVDNVSITAMPACFDPCIWSRDELHRVVERSRGKFESDFDDTVATDLDGHNLQIAVRIALGFCLWLQTTGGIEARTPQTKRHGYTRRSQSDAWPTKWIVGNEIKVGREVRDAAKEQCRSATKLGSNKWSEMRRHVVRGHMKHQAHGPNHSERKLIWIEPYWRGPDGAVGVAHRYEASDE